MSSFGTIVTPRDIGAGLEAHIRTWQRTALDMVATGRGFSRRLESIKSYRHVDERPEKWEEDSLPCCVIIVSQGEAERDADSYGLFFTAVVATEVGGRDAENAEAKASAYGGALALLLANRAELAVGPQQTPAEIVAWGGFDTGQITRTTAMSICGYTIFVSEALTFGDWPTVPTPDPTPGTPPIYPPTATAETVRIDVDQKPE